MIPVDNGGEFFAQLGQIVQRLADSVVSDIVGGGFGAEVAVVADILLEEAAFLVAADDGVWKIQSFDDGFQSAGVVLLDLTAKDDADLVGLSDGAVSIHQPLTESIDSGTA